MIPTIIRTAVLYIFVIIGMRLMGKRQIGDMQPGELVITILISEIAAIPIQDLTQPVLNSVIAIFILTALEIILSVLTMKIHSFNRLVNGCSALIIRDGKVLQSRMRSLRVTVDDLMEMLRIQQVFSLNEVSYAFLETNGTLSVLLKPEFRPATVADVSQRKPPSALPVLVISDGQVIEKGLEELNLTRTELYSILASKQLSEKQIFIMTLDKNGDMDIVKKEEKK